MGGNVAAVASTQQKKRSGEMVEAGAEAGAEAEASSKRRRSANNPWND